MKALKTKTRQALCANTKYNSMCQLLQFSLQELTKPLYPKRLFICSPRHRKNVCIYM